MASGEDASRRCRIVRAKPTVPARWSFWSALGTIEFLAHVVGDDLVQVGFSFGELVGGRCEQCAPGNSGAPSNLSRSSFTMRRNQVGGIGDMNAVPKAALEPVAVDERHEELKIFLLPVVRRGRHQQEMAGEARKQLTQPVALRVLDLAAKRTWPTFCGPRRTRRGPNGSREPAASAERPRCGRACPTAL